MPNATSTNPPASAYEVVIAKSVEDRLHAFRLRYAIFVNEIGAFKRASGEIEVDEFDAGATHVLAKWGDQVVGTCRVMAETPGRTDGEGSLFGMAGEAHYDYAPLRRDALRLAEVSRTTVLREHRGSAVLAKLWKCAYTYARRRGCSNFVALVQVGYTDSLVDATLIHDALLQQGMLHPRYELSMRHAAPAPSSPVCPLFSEAERSAPGRVRLPPVLRLFHRFGLRACGKPVFMPEVGRVGMAMLASPDTFSANTVQFFESPDPSIHLD